MKKQELKPPKEMKIIPNTEIEVEGKVLSCQISPDNTFVIIGSNDNKVRLAEIIRDNQGKIIGMKIIPNTEIEVGGWIRSFHISLDNTFVIIGSGNKKVRLLEIKRDNQGKITEMKIIPNTEIEVEGKVLSCHISPDNTFAIIGSTDKKVRLAEIIRDKEGKIIKMQIIFNTEVRVGGWIWCCQISSDNTFAIIGSDADHKVRLVEIIRDNQGKIIKMQIISDTEIEVEDLVYSCHISPDNTFAIIGSTDNKVRLAEIIRDNQGKIIKMQVIPNTKIEVGGEVYSCQISPDNTFAIIGSDDNKVVLAEIKRDNQGKIIAMEIISNTEIKVKGAVYSCHISPDNTFAIIGSQDHKVRLAEIIR